MATEEERIKALVAVAAAARIFLTRSDDMTAYQNLKAALAALPENP